MHRLLVATDLLDSDAPQLTAEAARHLKVLRPRADEEIELFDGYGHVRMCRWTDGRLRPCGEIRTWPRPDGTLTLFACVTKGSRWDWTIEKVTELGVTRLVPVLSDRTIVRLDPAERIAKRERWQRIAEEAARQSDAVYLPEILPAVDFKDTLALVRETTCFVGALVEPKAPELLAALRQRDPLPRDLAVFVGPEGDFTPDELAALLKIAIPTSFGPTVLRAETAAIFAVSVLASSVAADARIRRADEIKGV